MYKILFEDNKLLVVEKKPGILSQADFSDRSDLLSELKQYIKHKYNKPANVYLGLVHRLDKEVGGVMVFARNSKTAKNLSSQIFEYKFVKTYLAIVEIPGAKILSPQAQINSYLYKDQLKNKVFVIDPKSQDVRLAKAKLAQLEYHIINQIDAKALIQVNLLSGRSHQIRAQMADLGFPILGDKKYGSTTVLAQEAGIALWSYKLELLYPGTSNVIEFQSRPPNILPWSLFTTDYK